MDLDEHHQLKLLMETAIENTGGKVEEYEQLDRTDAIPEVLEQYLESIKEEHCPDFYQWFILVWQAAENLYKEATDEEDWCHLVNLVLPVLEMSKKFPKLCAMCLSYVYSSLGSHLKAQVCALRLMIHHAKENHLGNDQKFLTWILSVMRTQLEQSLTVEYSRYEFTNIILDFFTDLQMPYPVEAVHELCHAFNDTNFKSSIRPKKSAVDRVRDEKIAALANKSFDSICCGKDIFDFEVLADTSFLVEFLTEERRELLNILVSGTITEFEQFCGAHAGLFNEYNTKERLTKAMMKLEFVSFATEKNTFTFAELMDRVHIEENQVKLFIIEINTERIAVVKIDAGQKSIKVEQCQPRQFTQQSWSEVAERLGGLKNGIESLTLQ